MMNVPNNITSYVWEELTLKELQAVYNMMKSKRTYLKRKMNELGKLSLGNIEAYRYCLEQLKDSKETMMVCRKYMTH